MNKFLTQDQVRKIAPSIFADSKSPETSEKYSLIPTWNVLEGLRNSGFQVTQAKESKCRDENNKPFVKHMVRLRHENSMVQKDIIPEIVLFNSHNGLSSYQLHAGIYRLVCSNGLIVGNDLFCQRVKHQGDVIAKVKESAEEIIELMPDAIEVIDKWRSIELTEKQAAIYAESASLLKWDTPLINSRDLLNRRRYEDNAKDLWTTFNRVQENLLKGGQKYYLQGNEYTHGRPRRQTTRETKSVNENCRLNRALWSLTEALAKAI